MELMPHQEELLQRPEDEGGLGNGKVLWGGVGSGKSITALSYYLRRELIGDIYVITTAKKRDSLEWEGDAAKLGIGTKEGASVAGVLHVDSWNNIGKYTDVKGAFFIFDEQRVVGNGAWVKAFHKIARNANAWIILSATPGDTWLDYAPMFIANGWYKNITDFKRQHIVYRQFSRYPQIERYVGIDKLERLKREVLVEMPYLMPTTRYHHDVEVSHDVDLFRRVSVDRWHVYEDRPCRDGSELFAVMRKVAYGDPSRLDAVRELLDKHPKMIVFYNFNYELEKLRELNDTWSDMVSVAEWNGHRKEPIPDTDSWVYLVQYTAGSEGWNCTKTDTMVFYSLPYSYKKYEQAQGRIDRLNTAFRDLHYYTLYGKSLVDRAVRKSLSQKKSFNEKKWLEENVPDMSYYDGWNE